MRKASAPLDLHIVKFSKGGNTLLWNLRTSLAFWGLLSIFV